MPPNRVHRRVVLRDFGRPIYEPRSSAALPTTIEACIKGRESLYKISFRERKHHPGDLSQRQCIAQSRRCARSALPTAGPSLSSTFTYPISGSPILPKATRQVMPGNADLSGVTQLATTRTSDASGTV
ncbi:hypothetical protein GGS23DRAFT_318657 [Durotheca rogersii]|uniref:uncharacterized protein n=1 Tax=Durotheca rogersii TaxID=419775 RepID=UPI00222023C6|nr:uncharacterized protein GGS23DRAFT_318657 [Durotheca rogersii]KAI5859464.1 hypothetical protein GGS23DRAFT_318657 [Durotheca rogersii]